MSPATTLTVTPHPHQTETWLGPSQLVLYKWNVIYFFKKEINAEIIHLNTNLVSPKENILVIEGVCEQYRTKL